MNENPPVPPAPQPKKSIPAIGWVGIGCGTILIIAIVVISMLVGLCTKKVGEFAKNPEKTAAELMVKMNPDLEKVSQNEAKGEMTLRTKDGEEMTMSYKDVSEGKFTIKDAKGNISEFGGTDLSNVPAWVPRVPQIKNTTASIQNTEEGKVSGLYSATSAESIDALDEFFKAESAKLKVTESSRTTFNSDGVENRTLSYSGNGRTLNIVITGKASEDTQVNVGYEEEK